MNFVLELDFMDFLGLYSKLLERKTEEQAWDMWVTWYPNMEEPIQWAEFISRIKNQSHMEKADKGNNPIDGLYVDQIFF